MRELTKQIVWMSPLWAGVLFTAYMMFVALPVFAQTNSIGVCCAWNSNLADGVLTYKILGGDSTAQTAMQNAVVDWDNHIAGLSLVQVTGKAPADIQIKFKEGGGVIAGQTNRKSDSNGLVTSVSILISGKAFGVTNAPTIIEQVTKHEVGHALGAGHANFNGDLMSTTVQTGSGTISTCDVDAVVAANHWKLVDNALVPHAPHDTQVICLT